MKNTNPPTPAATQRIPPQNIEAEMSVLGGLLICGDNQGYVLDAVEMLRPEHFYREAHGSIFEAVVNLSAEGKPVDIVTLKDALIAIDALVGVGGLDYLVMLSDFVPTPSNMKHYAGIVLEKWKLRKVIETASEAAGQAWAEEESEGIISEVQQGLASVASVGQRGQWKDVKSLLTEWTDELDDRCHNGGDASAIPTGFMDIDRMIGGFKRGELVIVAARPSMGKSGLMLDMALKQGAAGYGVAIFSLEMSAKSLVQRAVSSMSCIPGIKFDSGRLDREEWDRAQKSIASIYDMPMSIEDESEISVAGIEAKLRELSLKGNIDVCYIDYLTLIRVESKGGDNYSKSLGDVTKALKRMSKKFDISVVCLAQLSRSVERREDKRPILSDLRESGSIEEDADKVAFIYRPMYYARKEEIVNTETTGLDAEEVETIWAKNRNGATGMVRLEFTPAYTRFSTVVESVY